MISTYSTIIDIDQCSFYETTLLIFKNNLCQFIRVRMSTRIKRLKEQENKR